MFFVGNDVIFCNLVNRVFDVVVGVVLNFFVIVVCFNVVFGVFIMCISNV